MPTGTSKRMDEVRINNIESRLNNIDIRFNNIDIRLNNLDSYLQSFENYLTTIYPQLTQQLNRIEGELKKAAIRDVQIAWLTIMAVGAGFVGAGISALFTSQNWVIIPVGIVMLITGLCGVRFRLFARRS